MAAFDASILDHLWLFGWLVGWLVGWCASSLGSSDIVRLPRLDQALEIETRSIKDNRSDRDLSTNPALI